MTEETIYQEMLSWFQTETGYPMTDGAELAVRLRAAARQIMGLYHYGDYIFRQAFPQTAEGESLERHGALRGISRQKARKAQGTLKFSIPKALTENLTIPVGTVCLTEERTGFETTVEGTLVAGNTSVSVAAQAQEPGPGGNVLAGKITKMQAKPDGIETVTNASAFTGGREEETDESLRERILETYGGLSNGTNISYYRQLALSVDGVDEVEVIPCMEGVGTVGVLIATENGTTPASVISAVNGLMAQRRELGIAVTVATPTKLEVTVDAALVPAEGYTLDQAIEAVEPAIRGCFQGNKIGKTVYLNAIIGAAMSTGTLENITVLSPTADVTATAKQRPVLKSLILGGT